MEGGHGGAAAEQALNCIWGLESIKKYTRFELLGSEECGSSLFTFLSTLTSASDPISVSSYPFVCLLHPFPGSKHEPLCL